MTAQARTLRRESAYPERKLWSRLRDGQLAGVRFRRQHVIGSYVADFYCADALLVTELDGHSHDATAAKDLRREEHLRRLGLQVIRFSNDQVIRNIDGVIEAIECAIGASRWRSVPPAPQSFP